MIRRRRSSRSPYCNKRDIDGFARCQREAGHREDTHYAELNGVIFEWGAGFSDSRPIRRRRRPQAETYEHELAEAFTDGIKASQITDQLLLYGIARCVRCCSALCRQIDIRLDENGDTLIPDELEAALAEAMTNSAKHHSERRSGRGYRPDRYGNFFGVDSPIRIETPLCHDCHTGLDSEIHPGPQFSKAAS